MSEEKEKIENQNNLIDELLLDIDTKIYKKCRVKDLKSLSKQKKLLDKKDIENSKEIEVLINGKRDKIDLSKLTQLNSRTRRDDENNEKKLVTSNGIEITDDTEIFLIETNIENDSEEDFERNPDEIPLGSYKKVEMDYEKTKKVYYVMNLPKTEERVNFYQDKKNPHIVVSYVPEDEKENYIPIKTVSDIKSKYIILKIEKTDEVHDGVISPEISLKIAEINRGPILHKVLEKIESEKSKPLTKTLFEHLNAFDKNSEEQEIYSNELLKRINEQLRKNKHIAEVLVELNETQDTPKINWNEIVNEYEQKFLTGKSSILGNKLEKQTALRNSGEEKNTIEIINDIQNNYCKLVLYLESNKNKQIGLLEERESIRRFNLQEHSEHSLLELYDAYKELIKEGYIQETENNTGFIKDINKEYFYRDLLDNKIAENVIYYPSFKNLMKKNKEGILLEIIKDENLIEFHYSQEIKDLRKFYRYLEDYKNSLSTDVKNSLILQKFRELDYSSTPSILKKNELLISDYIKNKMMPIEYKLEKILKMDKKSSNMIILSSNASEEFEQIVLYKNDDYTLIEEVNAERKQLCLIEKAFKENKKVLKDNGDGLYEQKASILLLDKFKGDPNFDKFIDDYFSKYSNLLNSVKYENVKDNQQKEIEEALENKKVLIHKKEENGQTKIDIIYLGPEKIGKTQETLLDLRKALTNKIANPVYKKVSLVSSDKSLKFDTTKLTKPEIEKELEQEEFILLTLNDLKNELLNDNQFFTKLLSKAAENSKENISEDKKTSQMIEELFKIVKEINHKEPESEKINYSEILKSIESNITEIDKSIKELQEIKLKETIESENLKSIFDKIKDKFNDEDREKITQMLNETTINLKENEEVINLIENKLIEYKEINTSSKEDGLLDMIKIIKNRKNANIEETINLLYENSSNDVNNERNKGKIEQRKQLHNLAKVLKDAQEELIAETIDKLYQNSIETINSIERPEILETQRKINEIKLFKSNISKALEEGKYIVIDDFSKDNKKEVIRILNKTQDGFIKCVEIYPKGKYFDSHNLSIKNLEDLEYSSKYLSGNKLNEILEEHSGKDTSILIKDEKRMQEISSNKNLSVQIYKNEETLNLIKESLGVKTNLTLDEAEQVSYINFTTKSGIKNLIRAEQISDDVYNLFIVTNIGKTQTTMKLNNVKYIDNKFVITDESEIDEPFIQDKIISQDEIDSGNIGEEQLKESEAQKQYQKKVISGILNTLNIRMKVNSVQIEDNNNFINENSFYKQNLEIIFKFMNIPDYLKNDILSVNLEESNNISNVLEKLFNEKDSNNENLLLKLLKEDSKIFSNDKSKKSLLNLLNDMELVKQKNPDKNFEDVLKIVLLEDDFNKTKEEINQIVDRIENKLSLKINFMQDLIEKVTTEKDALKDFSDFKLRDFIEEYSNKELDSITTSLESILEKPLKLYEMKKEKEKEQEQEQEQNEKETDKNKDSKKELKGIRFEGKIEEILMSVLSQKSNIPESLNLPEISKFLKEWNETFKSRLTQNYGENDDRLKMTNEDIYSLYYTYKEKIPWNDISLMENFDPTSKEGVEIKKFEIIPDEESKQTKNRKVYVLKSKDSDEQIKIEISTKIQINETDETYETYITKINTINPETPIFDLKELPEMLESIKNKNESERNNERSNERSM